MTGQSMAPTISSLLVPTPMRILDSIDEGDDVVTLRVAPVDGPVPAFEPAQVGMVGAFGVGEAAISISSAPHITTHHDYTIRRAGAITNTLVDQPVGSVITVRGPFGRPWPMADVEDRDLVIVAGGLGIAPLRAAIEQATQRTGDGRLVIVQGARSPEALLFRRDHERWQEAGAEIVLTIDRDHDSWDGNTGLVTDHLAPPGGPIDPAGTVFVCGPDPMMVASVRALADLGIADDQVWLTLERNMQCGNGLCGHCQLGAAIICRDGPVLRADAVAADLGIPER